jgi:hypothetical protein
MKAYNRHWSDLSPLNCLIPRPLDQHASSTPKTNLAKGSAARAADGVALCQISALHVFSRRNTSL